MKVSQLYVYPIKSLRGTPLKQAELTKHGFLYDRHFMLLKEQNDRSGTSSDQRYENMTIAHLPQMALFLTDLKYPDGHFKGEVIVTFKPPAAQPTSITIPLQPDISDLEPLDISMHTSNTKGYKMDEPYNDWFSARFGFPVVLVRLGPVLRPVLFQLSPISQPSTGSWLSSVTNTIFGRQPEPSEGEQITFADVAPYLVVSQTSVEAVSARLPADQPMDVTKFRPNIVLDGAPTAWEEDFWAELAFAAAAGAPVTLAPKYNCVRCTSLNVDHATGKIAPGLSGQVLKLLQKDRRVDKGQKYSPVFGRYCFLVGEGASVGVGDQVEVTKVAEERTVFDWPI